MICSRAVRKQAAWRVLAVATLVAAAACSSGKPKATPSATVPTAPAQTTTTDPLAVPDAIDAAYVNRVLAGLDAVVGDMARVVVQSKTIAPEAISRLRALYKTDSRLQLEIDILQEEARHGFSDYRSAPGNQKTEVKKLITQRATCIFAQVTRDYSAVVTTPAAPQNQWVILVPIDRSRDPLNYNRTSWMYAYDGFQSDGSEPANLCTA